jgi:beta-N-acetylhexosaminidase
LIARREQAARLAAALDDRLLAAQVIISGIDGRGTLSPDMELLLGECPAGGIVLFRYNLNTDTDTLKNLLAQCAALISAGTAAVPEHEAEAPGIPPFIAADHEGGSVNRFNPGVAALPPALSYWELAQKDGRAAALSQVEADSLKAGKELRALGLTLNLAPVAEYLTNDNSAFLGSRSYGPDPDFTWQAASAFIRGMKDAGILCAVKHFPGNAGPDPHRDPSRLDLNREELETLVRPFASLIRSGRAGAMMIAHTLVPARDRERIASLSQEVMEGWLRGELHFEGIIISDDFSMGAAVGGAAAAASGAATGAAGAAVLSLAAGADMVLVWPPDIRRTHRAIQAALADGSLSRERLRQAAERIIFEKIRLGLIMDLHDEE